jgi:ATP-binding cassette subfamily B protein
MVDTRTEERILNKVLEFRAQKTNLIVSHRLSTISHGGKLVEVGDHKTLMDRGNEYARLYEKQLLAKELEIGAS